MQWKEIHCIISVVLIGMGVIRKLMILGSCGLVELMIWGKKITDSGQVIMN